MNTKKNRNAGFTIIELIIVLVIISILAALIAFSYSGVRSRDRDAARQDNIDALQSHLEVYYAQNSLYPTLAQLNSTNWRADNMPDLNAGALQDPGWSEGGDCTQNARSVVLAQPAQDCYAYSPTSAAGEDCDNDKTPCAHYTLTATLETEEQYIKTSLN